MLNISDIPGRDHLLADSSEKKPVKGMMNLKITS
jgi:hypothetical protein